MNEQRAFSKQLLEATLEACQPFLSEKTPFLHYDEQGHKECIPLRENFFFVLSLMKTHQQKLILTAKALLERLLAFQVPQLGAFPTYLHDYPHEGRYDNQLDMLAAQLGIYFHYLSVFKKEEAQALQGSIEGLASYLYSLQAKHPFGPINSWKLSVCLQATRALFQQSSVQHLKAPFPDTKEVYTPETLGDLLLFASLCQGEKPLPQPFLEGLNIFWNQEKQVYLGPDGYPKMYGHEALPSLLHLLLQTSLPTYLPLHTALKAQLFSFNSPFFSFEKPSFSRPFSFPGGELYLVKKASCFMRGQRFFSPVSGCRFFPFSAFFQDEGQEGSLCIEGSSAPENFELFEQGMQFQLPITDKDPLVSLYFSKHPGSQVLVGHTPATCFNLGDDIYLKSKAKLFKVVFFTKGFCDKLVGHVKFGNRPGQQISPEPSLKGQSFPPAWDWQVYLRNMDLQPQRVINCRITYLGT